MNPGIYNDQNDISIQLNASFMQMKKEKGPANDPVWSRVQNIALNCLGTGFCILRCADPDEIIYRKIPDSKLQNLRNAFKENNPSLKEKAIKSIIDGIYSSPDEYCPQPFMVLDFNVPIAEKNIYSLSFAPFRKNFYNNDQKTDIPGGILDIIFPSNDGNETGPMVMLVKGEEKQAFQGVAEYEKKKNEQVELYKSIFGKILESGHPGENQLILEFDLIDLWDIKNTLSSPSDFLKEYVDYLFTYELPLQGTSESELKLVHDVFKKILKAAAGDLNKTTSATQSQELADAKI